MAGEEANRTLHLVLGAPVSRVCFAVAKAVAFLLLVSAAGALLWGAAAVAPLLVGVEVGKAHLLAMMAHLTACALFH